MCSASLPRLPLVTLAVFAVGVLLAALPESQRIALEYNRDALATGEGWRLWTGHFVHFSLRHAAVDLMALSALVLCLERRGEGWVAVSLLLCASPLLSLSLYFSVPGLTIYRGASGLCATITVMLGLRLWRDSRRSRPFVLIIAILFIGKLMGESSGAAANFSGLAGGVQVAWQAHLLGALLAALFDFGILLSGMSACGTFKKIVMLSSKPLC